MPSITDILLNFNKFILKFIAFLYLLAFSAQIFGNNLHDLFIVCYKLLPTFIRNYIESINITEEQFLNAFLGFLSIFGLTLVTVFILYLLKEFVPLNENKNRPDNISIHLIAETILPKFSNLWLLLQSFGISLIAILYIAERVFNNELLKTLIDEIFKHLCTTAFFCLLIIGGVLLILLVEVEDRSKK